MTSVSGVSSLDMAVQSRDSRGGSREPLTRLPFLLGRKQFSDRRPPVTVTGTHDGQKNSNPMHFVFVDHQELVLWHFQLGDFHRIEGEYHAHVEPD